MEKLASVQAATAIIAAVLAFRQKWDADVEEQEADFALMSEEQKKAAEETRLPSELEEQDWWEQFTSFIELNGLNKFLDVRHNADIACFAALSKNEPSFTLRGQDTFASILVKHWVELANGLSEDVRARKLAAALETAARMEDYHPQKFPD